MHTRSPDTRPTRPLATNPGQVRQRPATDDLLPPMPARRDHAGHYQALVLDLDAGEFFFHCEDWRVSIQERIGEADHAEMFPPFDYNRVPRRLSWLIDSGDPDVIPQLPWLDADRGNALAARALPYAQALAAALRPIPGRTEFDWTATAARAGWVIHGLCTRTPIEPDEDADVLNPAVRDITELLEACPDALDRIRNWTGGIGDATDDTIEFTAATFARGLLMDDLSKRLPGVATAFGWPESGKRGYQPRRTVLGARAWLYGARHDAHDGLDCADATTWFAEHPLDDPDGLRDAHDDELPAWATATRDRYRQRGVHILGLTAWAWTRRSELRIAYREAVVGLARDAAAATATAQRRVALRNAALNVIFGWGDPRDTDSALGREIGVSHTTVNNVRRAGAPTVDPADEVPELRYGRRVNATVYRDTAGVLTVVLDADATDPATAGGADVHVVALTAR